MPLAFESLSHGTIAFHELINYVWRGGYPRWKDEIRPDYVVSMKKTLSNDPRGVFDGIHLKV